MSFNAVVPTSLSRLQTDPLRNFKFQVNIIQTVPAGPGSSARNLVELGFTSVSGLSVTTEAIPYRQGGFNAQPLTAMVLTREGPRAMGDLEVGDRVVDPYGQDSKVTGVYPKGERDVYRVTLKDGTSTDACYQHLWEVRTGTAQTKRVVDTLELKRRVEAGHRVRVPLLQPVEYEALHELPLDPYLLGVLLSEGTLYADGVRFTQTTENAALIERVREALPAGHTLRSYGPQGCEQHAITVGRNGKATFNTVLAATRELGLAGKHSWEKFIPDAYKYATISDRLALLQGIMDGDGSVDERGRTLFGSSSRQLRDDVADLIRSLGGRCGTADRTGSWYTSPTQKTPKAARDCYAITGVHMTMNPFFLPAKADRFVPKANGYYRNVVSVEHVGREEVQCISVSADSHLYVTDGFIPTHNTTVQQIPGQTTFTPITLQRGAVLGTDHSWQWMRQLFSVIAGAGTGTAGAGPAADFRADVQILVLDHPVTKDNTPADQKANTDVKLAINVHNAWITSLSYSDLNAGDNALLVEQMTLVHEGFEMHWATGGSKGFGNGVQAASF